MELPDVSITLQLTQHDDRPVVKVYRNELIKYHEMYQKFIKNVDIKESTERIIEGLISKSNMCQRSHFINIDKYSEDALFHHCKLCNSWHIITTNNNEIASVMNFNGLHIDPFDFIVGVRNAYMCISLCCRYSSSLQKYYKYLGKMREYIERLDEFLKPPTD
jgi:hypothetical protein